MDTPNKIGERTEAIVIAALLKAGYTILIPFGNNQRYDIVIDHNGKFERVQCKTGRIRKGCIKFYTASTHLRNGRKIEKRDYRNQIESFAVYCPDNDLVYKIPVKDVGIRGAYLRIDEPVKGYKNNKIRWASDYVLKFDKN